MKITKITAAKKDDILKRRDEYDSETRKLEEIAEENNNRYNKARYDAIQVIEKKVSEAIGATSLDIRINVSEGYLFLDRPGWEVTVKANDNKMFDDSVALAWNWEASLDKDGNVKKDSGSWSGLKAVTPEQIADLEESVRVIKILNNMDWKEILNSNTVHYYDYHDKDNQDKIYHRKKARPDFESELQAAVLEDYIGGDVALKLKQDQYYRGSVWILPTGLTDKFIKGYIFSEWTAQNHGMNADEVRQSVDERRSARTNLVKNGSDFVTMELN